MKGRLVSLRRAVKGDRAEFEALQDASAAFLRPWFPAPWSAGAAFGRVLEDGDRFLICRNDDGAIVGGMNVSNVVRGVFQNATLGYWVGAAHAGRGYATEALQLVLRHVFRTLKLHRVEANIIPSNEPSRMLVARAGFRLEGVSPRFLKIAGRWQDHERWALLREEWTPLRSRPRRG